MATEVQPQSEAPPPEAAVAAPPSAPSQTAPRAGRLGWWLRKALLAAGGIAAVVVVGSYMIGEGSPEKSGKTLTHTISRGNLVVTVTEQGMLESSNNTEIKCKVRGYSTVIWVVEGGTEVKKGDELVRLDTKAIEDAVSLQTTNLHSARAVLAQSKANVALAELAIPAYLEGEYRSQLETLERGRAIAAANLATASRTLEHSKSLFNQGHITELQVEADTFLVTKAELELKVKETEIEALEKYTKKMRLETLNGNLTANKSKLEADTAGLTMDEGRLARALEELEQCVIQAEASGMVIYPSAAEWKNTPDIAEGATVRKDQVLLLMPDLSKMQVKVGVHESVVDLIKPGQPARVTLPEQTLDGKVSSVASVTRPAGWWTGNVVKYDTIIELPSVEGLKPGMSAEVEIVIDRHEDVLTVPVAAVVETVDGDFCWVKTDDGTQRRSLALGDTNDSFIVVDTGLKEGDEVMLNPLAFIEEAQKEVLKPPDEARLPDADSGGAGSDATEPANQEAPHAD